MTDPSVIDERAKNPNLMGAVVLASKVNYKNSMNSIYNAREAVELIEAEGNRDS